ncbi:putative porin [Acinetobacter sp. 194]|uniref:putative porin n=1 Tax=Acinetobacter shaoyimingii TaxID=2715164 RepID=UPI00140972B0|nr:putative porin [Acinetobacter shaoyimingii]NHB56856.1 putative porin [Acinetobacter shaoyimingii]
MLKKIALLSALTMCMGSSFAYQAEVGGSYNYVDYDTDPSESIDDQYFGIDGTYYFNRVEVKNNPFNEAAFLNRASNINAKIIHNDTDIKFSDSSLDLNLENGSTLYQVGIEYFIPNSNFYVNAHIGNIRNKQHVDFIEYPEDENDEPIYTHIHSVKSNVITYSAEIGYLPISNLLIAAGFTGFDGDNGDDIDPTLRAKYVTPIGSYDLNLEANAQFGDDTIYNLGADLYLNKTLSIGFAYTDNSDELIGLNDLFTIRAKKFFTQNVSLEAKADFGDDVTQYGIRFGYRF